LTHLKRALAGVQESSLSRSILKSPLAKSPDLNLTLVLSSI
jgi:hypothetical protein